MSPPCPTVSPRLLPRFQLGWTVLDTCVPSGHRRGVRDAHSAARDKAKMKLSQTNPVLRHWSFVSRVTLGSPRGGAFPGHRGLSPAVPQMAREEAGHRIFWVSCSSASEKGRLPSPPPDPDLLWGLAPGGGALPWLQRARGWTRLFAADEDDWTAA